MLLARLEGSKGVSAQYYLMYVPRTICHLYFVVPSVLVEVTTTGLPESPKQLLRPASPPKQNCFDTKLVRYSSSLRSQPTDGGHAAAVTASKQTCLLTTGSSSSCSTVASLPPSQYGFVSGSGQLTRPQPCNDRGKLNGKKILRRSVLLSTHNTRAAATMSGEL